MKDGYRATPELWPAVRRSLRSVRSLAEELGYSKTHLYAVIRGAVPVRPVVAERIATLLNADFSVLFVLSNGNGEEA